MAVVVTGYAIMGMEHNDRKFTNYFYLFSGFESLSFSGTH